MAPTPCWPTEAVTASSLEVFARFAGVLLIAATLVLSGVAGFRRLSKPRQNVTMLLVSCVHIGALVMAVEYLPLSNALVLATAAGGAVLIGRAVTGKGALIALAVTASIVDIASFTGGPTAWLLSSQSGGAEGLLRYLTVSVPWDERIVPAVGIGDLLLLGSFAIGLRLLGQSRWVAAVVPGIGLLAAMAIGLAVGGAFGIPFMAAGVVLVALTGRGQNLLADAR